MDLRLRLRLERGQRGCRGLAFGSLLLEVLAGDEAAAHPGRDQLFESLLACKLGLGIGDPRLHRAQA